MDDERPDGDECARHVHQHAKSDLTGKVRSDTIYQNVTYQGYYNLWITLLRVLPFIKSNAAVRWPRQIRRTLNHTECESDISGAKRKHEI
jgi:hypothetical protein